jgi:hypothetical protein
MIIRISPIVQNMMTPTNFRKNDNLQDEKIEPDDTV